MPGTGPASLVRTGRQVGTCPGASGSCPQRPSHGGKAAQAQRWFARVPPTPSRVSRGWGSDRYPAWSWETEDAGPEQAGEGSHSHVLHSEPTWHFRGSQLEPAPQSPHAQVTSGHCLWSAGCYFVVKSQCFESNHSMVQLEIKERNESF